MIPEGRPSLFTCEARCRMFAICGCLMLATGLTLPVTTEACKNGPSSKGQQQAPLDQYGDPLPEGALARIGTIKFRHPDWIISALAFSPNGKIIATSTRMEFIHLWDVATGKEVQRIVTGTASLIFFTPEGKLVFSWGEDQIRSWEADTGKEVRRIKVPRAATGATAISGDGKRWACAGEDNIIHLGEISTGLEIRQIAGDQKGIRRLAFSPDGKTLASTDGHTIRLWDVITGKQRGHFDGPNFNWFEFSPNGKRLGIVQSTYLQPLRLTLWEWDSRKPVAVFGIDIAGGSFANEGRMVFSPDGRTLAIWGSTIKFLNVATGKEIGSLKASGFLMAFSPDSQTLATAEGNAVCLWNVATAKAKPPSVPPLRPSNVTFSPDGKTLAGVAKDEIRLWDAATGKDLRRLQPGWVDCLAYSPDGKTLAGGGVRLMIAWDIATGKIIRSFGKEDEQKRVFHCSFSLDGKWLATGQFLALRPRIWDMRNGKEVHQRTPAGLSGFHEVSWSPPPPLEIPVPPAIVSLSFSPDSRLLASGYGDGTIRLMSLASGKQVRVFGRDESLISVAFSDDGKTLVSVGSSIVSLWEVATGAERRSFAIRSEKDKEITALALSADAKRLAFAKGRFIFIWDVPMSKERRRLQGPQESVTRLIFSPDGRRLATEDGGTTVLVWDVEAVLKSP